MVPTGMNFDGLVTGSKWTRTINHLEGLGPFGGGAGGVEGSGAGAIHHPFHVISRKHFAQLSTSLVGRVTAPEVFCKCRIRTTTAHAHNTLPVFLINVCRLSPNLVYWVTDMGIITFQVYKLYM